MPHPAAASASDNRQVIGAWLVCLAIAMTSFGYSTAAEILGDLAAVSAGRSACSPRAQPRAAERDCRIHRHSQD